MPYADYAPGEITARGETLYRERIFPELDPAETGKFVAIDIESGDYEIDAEDPYACRRLLERRPQAVICGLRVGARAAYSFGGFGPAVGYD